MNPLNNSQQLVHKLITCTLLVFFFIGSHGKSSRAKLAPKQSDTTAAQEIAIALVKQALEAQMRTLMIEELQERIASLKQESRSNPRNAQLKSTIVELENIVKDLQHTLSHPEDQTAIQNKTTKSSTSPNKLALEILMTMQLVDELNFKAEALAKDKTMDPNVVEEIEILNKVIHSFNLDIQQKRGLLAALTQEIIG